MQVVKEMLETGSTSLVARRHGIRDSVMCRWVQKFKERGEGAFDQARSSVGRREPPGYRAVMS